MTVQPHGNPMNNQSFGAISPPDSMLDRPYSSPSDGNNAPPLDTMRIPSDESTMLYGPGLGQTYEEYYEQIPEEVRAFFAEDELDDRKFHVKLLCMPEGTTEGMAEFMRSWSQAFPSEEWITNNYGPGNYILVFSWRGKKDGAEKAKTYTKRAYINISEKNREKYDEYQMARYLEKTRKTKHTIRTEKMKAHFEREIDPLDIGKEAPPPPQTNPREEARAYLSEVMGMAQMMGLSRPSGQDRKIFDAEGIVKLIAATSPIIVALISKMGSGNGLINLLVEQGQKHTANLIELVKTRESAGSGSSMMKEIKDMVVGSLDIKDALHGEKDSTVDKVIETIMRFTPILAMFAGQRREQLAANPVAQQAQSFIGNDPNFQEVMGDRVKIIKLINGLDSRIGWEQTDAIIAFGDIERPAECPRDESTRYAPGDARNSAEPSQAAPEADILQ